MEASEFDGAQPSEGQDANESGDTGFYQEYLQNQVPEDYREHVEPYLRNIESNANEKFREHAEYRKQWEPYEELNLNQVDPEAISNLLQFAELVNDEENSDQFNQWWQEIGRQRGFFDALDGDDEDDDEEYDSFDGEDGQLNPDALRGLFEEVLDQRLSPLEERQQQEEQQRYQQEATSSLEQQMASIAEEHGLDDKAQERVYKLAYAHADDSQDPLADGLQDYLEMRSDIESSIVNGKVKGPQPPEPGGGRPNTSQKVPTSMEEATEMARARLADLKRQ